MVEDEKSLANILRNLEISVHSKTAENIHTPSTRKLDFFRPRSRSTGSICCSNCVRSNARIKINFTSKVSFKPKLLKEPVLKYTPKHLAGDSADKPTARISGARGPLCRKTKPKQLRESAQLKSLLDSCEQLVISNGVKFKSNNFHSLRTRQKTYTPSSEASSTSSTAVKTNKMNNSSNATCSQAAMATMTLNTPCDVTIDELASYFETLVHIPKKMSSMAEMMYI